MRLCIHAGKHFKGACKNPHWRKVKQMQPMYVCIFLYNALRAHLIIHSGEKSNKCNQCDYACSDPSALRTHLKTHTGEKPNKCNRCDYASSQTGHLRSNLKTHSGEKSNKCNQCDYESSCVSNFRRHLKIHRRKVQQM